MQPLCSYDGCDAVAFFRFEGEAWCVGLVSDLFCVEHAKLYAARPAEARHDERGNPAEYVAGRYDKITLLAVDGDEREVAPDFVAAVA